MAGPVDIDPFEEFEFKPLNEGLGFHRQPDKTADKSSDKSKDNSRADDKRASGNTAFEIPSLGKLNGKASDFSGIETPKSVDRRKTSEQNMVNDLLDLGSLEPKDLDKPLLRTPLLRKQKDGKAPAAPQTEKVDDVLQAFQGRKWDFKEKDSVRQSLNAPQETVYRTTGYDFSALILDAMLVIAGFLGCLIVLLMVTQVDLIAAVTTASSLMLGFSLVAVLSTICFIYLTINRLFLGATPGEWVFDQRLGTPDEQGRAAFSLKVVARSVIVLATGLVIFPVLSLLMGRDLLGRWIGLELHQKTIG